MNCCFYSAIDRLHLATVAAIEFLPVIVLAALGARTRRNVARAAAGRARASTCSPACISSGEALGVALAFANAGLFAAYIVLGAPRGVGPVGGRDRRAGGGDARRAGGRHAAGGLGGACRRSTTRSALLAGIGVGVSSSVIPYVADQVAMKRLTRSAYALMVSLLPATATVIGLVVLTQVPSLHRRARDRPRHRGGGAPSRAHTSASRTTVAAAAAISCSDAHSRGE